jgi:hypothetical protein
MSLVETQVVLFLCSLAPPDRLDPYTDNLLLTTDNIRLLMTKCHTKIHKASIPLFREP